MDFLVDVLDSDVDEGDGCESSSEGNTGDVEGFVPCLSLDENEVVGDVGSDGFPHVVVDFLDFAAFAGVVVFDLG